MRFVLPILLVFSLFGETEVIGYNKSAQIGIDEGFRVFLVGSFLYWQGMQEGLEFASEGAEPANNFVNGNVFSFDRSCYTPALKIGLGFQTLLDNWDLYFQYTRFHFKDSKTATPSAGKIMTSIVWFQPTNTQGNNNISEAKATWNMKMDYGDAQLSRPFFVGKKLVVKPFFGLRGGVIDQNFTLVVNVINQNNAARTSNNKSDSWFIGARSGLDSEWHLGQGFFFLGNIDANFVYTKYKTKHDEDSYDPATVGSTTFLELEQIRHFIRGHQGIELGFGWERLFTCEFHGRFEASYEFHRFESQNLMRIIAQQGTYGGNLYTHGLKVSARFDF